MNEPGGILNPGQTRALLERLGHLPRKALGQNFLVDGNIVRKSLSLAEVHADDLIVEIGPGLGTLTAALLGTGAKVFAVERDPTLAAHLRDTLLPHAGERLDLVEGDAVDLPLAGLKPDAAPPFQIVANLPYAIATPWLEGVLSGPLPTVMVLMLQKEAADRFTAKPGTKTFGAISIFLEAAYDRVPGHPVSRRCFHPEPAVDSVLLHLRRKPDPRPFHAAARQTIRDLFTQRRKQLGSLCRKHPLHADLLTRWCADIARDLAIPPETRPEAVPYPAWQRLQALLPENG